MKLLGFMLITFSSTVCGFCYCAGKRDRLDTLQSFCSMLEIMQAEIMEKLTPLPDLFKYLTENSKGQAAVFLSVLSFNIALLGQKGFEVIWKESLINTVNNLKEKELESLVSLGKTLGRYDPAQQRAAIMNTRDMLYSSLKKEQAELPQLRKISLSISMTAGALCAILLI